MERSTQLQLRSQTLADGLSVIAAAYYLVGSIGYVSRGVAVFPSGSQSDVFVAAITLPVIPLIHAFVHYLHYWVLKVSGGRNGRIAD